MMVVGEVTDFKSFSEFKSIKDFNKNIEMFLAVHKKEFTKTEYMVFRRLTKFAAKVPGVAVIRMKTLIDGIRIKDFFLGCSKSSIKRMRKKAVELGILEVQPLIRSNGSSASNLWVFKRFESKGNTIEPRPDSMETKKKGRQCLHLLSSSRNERNKHLTPLKASNIKADNININKRIEKPFIGNNLDHTFTSDYIPKDFVKTVSPFYDDAAKIEEFWRMVRITSFDYRNSIDSPRVLWVAIDSFKQTVAQEKKRRLLKPIAYFTEILKRKLDHELSKESIDPESSYTQGKFVEGKFYNWLTERAT